MNRVLNNKKWIICIIAFIIFILSLVGVFSQSILNIDSLMYSFISSFKNSNVTTFAKNITMFCNTSFIIMATFLIVFVLLLIKKRRIAKYVAFNLIAVVALNNILKFLISRPRPDEFRLIEATGFSFPSGHAMVSMAFYGMLIYFVYEFMDNPHWKWFMIFILSLLIMMIGLSRIYLGVHYTSDVIAGFGISLAYLIVYVHVMEKRMNL